MGSDTGSYTKADIGGTEAYVRTKFTPVELNRLKSGIEKLARKTAAAGVAPDAAPTCPQNPGSGDNSHGLSGRARAGTGKRRPSAPRRFGPDDIIPVIQSIWPALVNKETLESQRFCQREFGLNEPLVKRGAGEGDAYPYVRMKLCGEDALVYARLNAVQMTRLRRFAERLAGGPDGD